jgi:hypothetical protein
MKRFIFLFSFLVLLPIMARSQTRDKILWKQDSLITILPFAEVHPNGNILCGRNAELYELDGSTGRFIRWFGKFINDNFIESFSISKDGKYLLCSETGNNVVDYITGKRIWNLNSTNLKSRSVFYPDRKRTFTCNARALDDFSTDLKIFNIETKSIEKKIISKEFSWAEAVTISDDGSLLVIAGKYIEGYRTNDKRYSRIILYNPITLDTVKTIESVEHKSDVYRTLKVSNDNKYLFILGAGDLRIYNLITSEFLREYNWHNKPNGGVSNFCIINNSTIAITSGESSDTTWFEIDDFVTNQVLYRTNEFGSYASACAYNPVYNSLIVTGTKYGHIALDMNKLVTVAPGTGSQPVLNATYQNGIIQINNIFTGLNMVTVKVINLQGQTIHNSQIDPLQYPSGLQIPVVLSSGSYIVQIIDASKDYSGKMMVIE